MLEKEPIAVGHGGVAELEVGVGAIHGTHGAGYSVTAHEARAAGSGASRCVSL